MKGNRIVWTVLVCLLVAIWLGFQLATPVAVETPLPPKNRQSESIDPQTNPPAPAPELSATSRLPERMPEPKSGEKSGGEMLEEWLSQPESTDAAGLRIMQNFLLLPEKDHAAAMRHLVNMVRDPSISGLERILLDSRTSLEAKEMLFEDIKIRPDAVKFPIFLKLMQHPEHPSSQDAREILTNVIGRDWGADYARWEKEIERVLKD